jgi:hypothetical protein
MLLHVGEDISLTRPRSLNSVLHRCEGWIETRETMQTADPWCEYVSKIRTRGNMENLESTESHLLARKMNVKLNMLSTTMLYWVVREVNNAHIVTVNNGSIVNRSL